MRYCAKSFLGGPLRAFLRATGGPPESRVVLYAHSSLAADLGLGTMISEYASIRIRTPNTHPASRCDSPAVGGAPSSSAARSGSPVVPSSSAASPLATAQLWGRMRSSLGMSLQVAIAGVLAVSICSRSTLAGSPVSTRARQVADSRERRSCSRLDLTATRP